MKSMLGSIVSLGICVALAGCAAQDPQQALDQAHAEYQGIVNDPQVQRSAPKDVVRAGEALERAQRFVDYLGGDEDAIHYAYLSQRYSQIARHHSEQLLNQERASRLGLERERLRQLLQEARLLDAQQGRWLDDQMLSLAAAETDRGLVVTLGDVLFKTESAELEASANRTLLKLVSFLQLNPQRKVRVEGYSDNSGDATENLLLSRARARSVSRTLTDLGIDTARIEVVGYGERFPVAENASARGRALNRRVEIVLSDEQGELGPIR
ncbi:OmpA family protein [Stutzerimonas nitrititolerans]|uniref:OmpA family protein n=1 Tax=Stutzerimonas nitrititolerans TaxID=2482751 RepID=A0AA42BEV8_9GAMM|nr:OmpA family protein [Stutzerimonas nitrititolerans]MCO7546205.1 OmpA family protein [Stutzerimonas nitrititolerans]